MSTINFFQSMFVKFCLVQIALMCIPTFFCCGFNSVHNEMDSDLSHVPTQAAWYQCCLFLQGGWFPRVDFDGHCVPLCSFSASFTGTLLMYANFMLTTRGCVLFAGGCLWHVFLSFGNLLKSFYNKTNSK